MLEKCPVQVKFLFQNRVILLPQRVVMGLINHSEAIRARLQGALFLRKSEIVFSYTELQIEDSSWLWALGGDRQYLNWGAFDLVGFLVFAHSYLFQEDFICSLIRNSRLKFNPAVKIAAFYCSKFFQWGTVTTYLLQDCLGIHEPDFGFPEFHTYSQYASYLRSIFRSRKRFETAPFFRDPYTGYTRICSHDKNCKLCPVTFDDLRKLKEELNGLHHGPEFSLNMDDFYVHYCPSFCTSSFSFRNYYRFLLHLYHKRT